MGQSCHHQGMAHPAVAGTKGQCIASITTSVFYFDRSVTGECHLGCLAAGSENLCRCMAFDLAGSCPHASGFGRPLLHYKANALYYKF